MADDDRRVEAYPALAGRGLGATPERIAALERQSRELQRLRRRPPTRAFADLLKATDATGSAAAEEDLSAKEKRRRRLPKKGPKPGLAHPRLRRQFGRDAASDEEVVLKG